MYLHMQRWHRKSLIHTGPNVLRITCILLYLRIIVYTGCCLYIELQTYSVQYALLLLYCAYMQWCRCNDVHNMIQVMIS